MISPLKSRGDSRTSRDESETKRVKQERGENEHILSTQTLEGTVVQHWLLPEIDFVSKLSAGIVENQELRGAKLKKNSVR